MAYDFRGKQVFRHTDSPYLEIVDTSRTRYDGFGAVVAVDRRKATGSVIEFSDEFDVDALGNVWSLHANRGLADGTRGQVDSYYNGGLQYNRETNPLAHVRDQSGWGPLITSLNTTESAFDNSGNLIKSHEWLAVYSHTTQDTSGYSDEFDDHPAVGEAFTRNFYGADEKLRVSQRTMNTAGSPRHVQTEYRYDALGRRVLLRSRTDSTKCGTSPVGPDCLPTIERFYWDGDQLLVEHRGDGGYSETLSTLNALPTTSTWYGRVRYMHAMGIDDPLVVRKTGSTPFVPHRSGRGGFEAGTYWTGASMDAYHWPQRNAGVYLAPDARADGLTPLGWFGSLLDGKTDPNGLQYMRNRYYDPASGRFTQRDPIGLGGGLNSYGYAGGDPINFWDPFGLCPDSLSGEAKLKCLEEEAQAAEEQAREAREAAAACESAQEAAMLSWAADGASLLPGVAVVAYGRRAALANRTAGYAAAEAEILLTEAYRDGIRSIAVTESLNLGFKAATSGQFWRSVPFVGSVIRTVDEVKACVR